jgi:hypothetical protein
MYNYQGSTGHTYDADRQDCHTCTNREYCDHIHCEGYTYDM